MNITKSIIQRNLPLDTKYILIDKKYLSIIDGGGCSCDNCGALIANIATVKNEIGKSFNIGFDCLETFLINNNLLDGKSIEEYKLFKSQLPTIIKKAKELSTTIKEFNAKYIVKVLGIEFDVSFFKSFNMYGKSSYLSFEYIKSDGKRENDNIRIKNDFNIDEFLTILKYMTKIEVKTK